MALASGSGGARIGAATASGRLLVFEPRLRLDKVVYEAVGDCLLPAPPTSVAALQLPAPAFAVGCTGRQDDSTNHNTGGRDTN